jgi:hypothetical protein
MLEGVQWIALLTLFAFGCATVRVTALPETEVVDAPGTIAPPVVELWVESSEGVSPAESERAAEAAQQAISQALSELQVSATALGAADAVLFVRERGVALTDARSRQQTWAKLGIVAVVAALIVAVVVSSRSGGGRNHFTRAAMPRASGGGATVRPIARNVVPIPAGPRAPRFLPHYSPVPVFVSFNFFIPLQPLVVVPVPEDDAQPFPPDAPIPMIEAAPLPPGLETEQLATNDGPPAPAEAAPPPLELPRLEPPAGFDVENRGFFDGTQIGLQLDLLDRATGELLWSKPVASDGNPCDPRDVGKLLAAALDGQAWARPALRAERP